jgi:hypothetical protein
MDEGKELILWTINSQSQPSPNQLWKLQAAGGADEYKLVSEQNEMCLSVEVDPLKGLKDGARIVQLANAGEDASNQIWSLQKNNGQYSLCSKLSSKMLTVHGFGTDRGTPLVQFEPMTNADSQAFRLKQVK